MSEAAAHNDGSKLVFSEASEDLAEDSIVRDALAMSLVPCCRHKVDG